MPGLMDGIRNAAAKQRAQGGPIDFTNQKPLEHEQLSANYQAKTGALPQFEAMRRRTEQRLQSGADQTNDALKRRFAAMGGINSGAFIKQQQVTGDNLARQKEDAMQGVEAAEAQELQRINEVGEQRAFAAQEAGRHRNFQRDITNQDMDFKRKLANFEAGSKMQELALAHRQFAMQKEAQDWNLAQAKLEAGQKPFGLSTGEGLALAAGSTLAAPFVGAKKLWDSFF